MQRFVFSLHIAHALLALLCCCIHVLGFSYKKEPIAHIMFYCGIYFGFCVISALYCIGMLLGIPVVVTVELALAFIAFTCYLIASLLSMTQAERDDHLLYLTDLEEATHIYFLVLRLQSMASLTASLVYLLHFILLLDMKRVHSAREKLEASGDLEKRARSASEAPIGLDEYEANTNIELYSVCDPCFNYFQRKFPRCFNFKVPDFRNA